MDNKIEIVLNNGYKLVAERNSDPNFPNEIFVGLVNDKGVWWQDLAVVRTHYYTSKDNKYELKENKDKFDVLVYRDANNEDYTNKYTIDLYKEDDSN